MADVFLSYARADFSKAEQVKAALESVGLSVFFDVEGLDGGDVFPDVLDREVKTAGAVVSLWSPHSLSRPWVKQECSVGLKRRCLIPVAIETLGDLDVPVAFEGLQVIDFTGYHGGTDTPEWTKLMRSLARTLGRPDLVAASAPSSAPPRAEPAPIPKPEPSPAVPPAEPAGSGKGVMAGVWISVLLAFAGVGLVAPGLMDSIGRSAVPGSASVADDTAYALPADTLTELEPGDECGDVEVVVHFEFDRVNLTPSAASMLEQALRVEFNCQLLGVRIMGHEDLVDNAAYAVETSQRRGEAVANMLTRNGVDARIITVEGYGSSQPLEPGTRAPANRRVEATFDYAWPEAPPH